MVDHEDDDRPFARDDLAAHAPFPPEDGWLDLEPPPIGDEFVDRTLARLVDVGLVQGTARAADDEAAHEDDDRLDELLANYRPPAASAAFVERTLAATQRERSDQWRRLLLRYEAPEPTPDFVARTLAALRPAAPPQAVRRRLWFVVGAAAAAAALMLLLRPSLPGYALRAIVAQTNASTAVARSPALLSHLIVDLPEERADDGRPPAAPDAAWLWLASTETGR